MNPIEKTGLTAVAEEAARKVIIQHLQLCPFAGLRIEERVRKIENNYARLIGFMLGSGLLSGATAAAVTHLLPH